MVNRSDKLKRLVNVQRQLEKIAETELADLSARRVEVQESLVAAVEAVGSVNPVHQLFVPVYAGQISRLTVRDSQLAGQQSVQEQKILRERAKGDRLEESMREARTHENRMAEDEQIFDLVDQTIGLEQSQASSKLDRS